MLADPSSLRTLLSDRRSDVEAYLVAIENLHGAGNARSVHTAIRLFRRTSCTWRHRLHEQVVAADDPGRRLRIGYLTGARIIHRGYAAEVFESRHKAERNLAIAQAALDDDELSRPYALMNYGRALESAGRSVEAIDALREAAAGAEDPITRRLAIKNLIYILGRLGRFDESLAQVDELRRISVNQIAADIAEGRMRIAMGEAKPACRYWPACPHAVGTTMGWSMPPTCWRPCGAKRWLPSVGSARRPTSCSMPCGVTGCSKPTSVSSRPGWNGPTGPRLR